MPKTTVYEYDLSTAGKNQVGLSRQVAAMKPKTISQSMHDLSDKQFGFGIPASDQRHDPTTFTIADMVHGQPVLVAHLH